MQAPLPGVVRVSLVVGALLALALLAWRLADVMLLAFAAVLFAVILRSLASPIERHTPVNSSASLAIAVVLVAAIVGLFSWVLGAQLQSEARALVDRTPELLSSLGERLGVENLPERVTKRTQELLSSEGIAGRVASYTSWAVGVGANLVLVLVAGIYLARKPERYVRGVLALLPQAQREEGKRFLGNTGRALQLWLVGQVVSMVLVGVLTTIGLYAIGMPSPLALGLIAGLAEFVPLVGPALAAIPAVLLALPEGGSMLLWVLGLYVLVQQVEGNLIMPLVQRHVVDLPPVLTLFSILSFGLLFGPLGILVSTPLTVVVFVAVKQLYLRRVLGEDTEVPGEVQAPSSARENRSSVGPR